MKMTLKLLFMSEKHKALKKVLNEELMHILWHPRRSWNFYISEDGKREIESIFTE